MTLPPERPPRAASIEADAGATAAPEHVPSMPPAHAAVVLPLPRSGLPGMALGVLATLASLVALHLASAVVVPLLLGLTFSYALTPLVNRMVRLRLPRTLAAGLLLIGILAGFGTLAWSLSDDAASMIESMPDIAQRLRRNAASHRSPAGAIDKVQRVATELEGAARDSSPSAQNPARSVTRVQIEPPRLNVRDYLWSGTLGLASIGGQATVVLFITFFLLASGDTFRRKMVKIAGPGFGHKRLTLQALDEIDAQIQRYLVVQVFTSALVGVATWLAFLFIGVEHAAVWGALGFVLNFVPYFGSIVITGASALFGFIQFGSYEMALLIGGVSLFIHSVEGHVLTPWLTVRTSRMNPVAVFVGVLAWGWLWGLGGLFLGLPILIAIKAVCDRVDELKAVGELLGH